MQIFPPCWNFGEVVGSYRDDVGQFREGSRVVPVHGRPQLERRSNDRGRVIGDEGVERRDDQGCGLSLEGKV
jgi:hypothetical protein